MTTAASIALLAAAVGLQIPAFAGWIFFKDKAAGPWGRILPGIGLAGAGLGALFALARSDAAMFMAQAGLGAALAAMLTGR